MNLKGLFSKGVLIHICTIVLKAMEDISYVRVGHTLKEIDCNKANMIIISNSDTDLPMCRCFHGYFLWIRSTYDMSKAKCARCTTCSYDKFRPYEKKKCGIYHNTLCCTHEYMAAAMKNGTYDCIVPESVKDRSDGPVCGNDHFLQKDEKNESIVHCAPCTVCRDLKDTPYEILPCTNVSDSKCCARRDMQILKTDKGLECWLPGMETTMNPLEVTTAEQPESVTDDKVNCDQPGMHFDKHGKCVCTDGSHAELIYDHFECSSGGGTRDIKDNEDGDPNTPDKEKYPRRIFFIIIILTILLVAFVFVCWVQRRGWFRGFGSNERQIENEARKKEKLLETPL